ncbi:MAG: hypothetical protein LBR33_01505, partial [Propionibacteriaceae bacterium]|nr:hypothetical protein [Propionibacteriaceae bacterium]
MTETPQPDSLVQASAEAGAVTVPWDDLPADPTIQVKPPAPGAGVPEPEAMATGSGTPGLATGSGTPGYGARNERQPGGPDTVAKPETPAPPQETPEAEDLSEDDITTAPVPPPPGAHSSRVFPGDGPGVLWQAGEDADQTQPMAPPDPTLVVGATCAECGGVIDQDGYCTQCGARARSARDHYTLTPADWVAGACDIGLYHRRNEDALA